MGTSGIVLSLSASSNNKTIQLTSEKDEQGKCGGVVNEAGSFLRLQPWVDFLKVRQGDETSTIVKCVCVFVCVWCVCVRVC